MPKRPPKQTRDPPRTTRSRILASAERLFADRGFAKVSMPLIAKASGITAGAIYKHFDGKEDLFFEVVQRAVQSIPTPAAMDHPFDVATDLPRIVASYTAQQMKLLRELAVEVHSASAKHPRIRRLLRHSLTQRIAQMRDVIMEAQKTRRLDPALDAELLATTVLVFVLGLMHLETVAPELVGDAAWHDFVEVRVAALLGVRD
jgi:AcrR family transcriptional regulator